jgi:CheY-like chemotaxis protein
VVIDMNTLKILLLEDSPDDADLIERALQKKEFRFNMLRVDCSDEFILSLQMFKPDVILSDHSLPQFNSIEALHFLQHSDLKIPFILVTGTVSDDFALRCLEEGAHDYVLKNDLEELAFVITSALQKVNGLHNIL